MMDTYIHRIYYYLIIQGAITGNATPATNARGQVVKNSQNIPQNVQAATQPQNIPQATILPKDTSTGQNVPVASEV
jgi:hypothetical protein